ncbi:MAG: NUDIX domain-containing protein [Candidatus Hadarchaeia archaeon]
MSEDNVPKEVLEARRKLPKFDDGRINYTDAEKAPVVVIFMKYENEILIMKRSQNVGTHPGKWGLVAGYLDELKSVIGKGLEEISEETGIEEDKIEVMERKGKLKWFSDEAETTYISYILLVKLNDKPEIKLSWEHEDYKWIDIEEADKYLSPNAVKELKIALS